MCDKLFTVLVYKSKCLADQIPLISSNQCSSARLNKPICLNWAASALLANLCTAWLAAIDGCAILFSASLFTSCSNIVIFCILSLMKISYSARLISNVPPISMRASDFLAGALLIWSLIWFALSLKAFIRANHAVWCTSTWLLALSCAAQSANAAATCSNELICCGCKLIFLSSTPFKKVSTLPATSPSAFKPTVRPLPLSVWKLRRTSTKASWLLPLTRRAWQFCAICANTSSASVK